MQNTRYTKIHFHCFLFVWLLLLWFSFIFGQKDPMVNLFCSDILFIANTHVTGDDFY